MDISSIPIGLLILIALMYMYIRNKRIPIGLQAPGPKGYPLIGSALQIKSNRIHHQFYEFARRYGRMFKLKIVADNILVLNTVDLVNKAYCRDGGIFSNRPHLFMVDHIQISESSSFRNVDRQHNQARKSLVKGLNVYGNGIPQFEKVIGDEMDRVLKQIESFDGEAFEVTSLIRRSLINVVSILLIGKEATEDDVTLFSQYTKGEEFFLNPFVNTILTNFPFLLRAHFFKHKMDEIVQAKRTLLEKYFYNIKDSETTGNIHGLVEWFLRDQQQRIAADEPFLTDDEIKSIIMTDILSAGTLTSSSVLPNIILCLAHNPGYQARLQEEINRVTGVNGGPPRVSDKKDCLFIEAVVMETMRLMPPVPFLLPHNCAEDFQFEKVHVKQNTQVLANIWYIHHDETIWGDPWTFRPERFLDEDGKLLPNSHINTKSWMPFGTGRRRCPGMGFASTRIFLYVSSLFQKFTFMPAPGKSGSCDPRTSDFNYELIFKSNPFYCTANKHLSNVVPTYDKTAADGFENDINKC